MIYGYEEVFICQQKIISFDLLMKKKQRDKVLYGNVDQECTGIVTSCWASVDVIKYVIEKGANLIISHEALFWNHGDHQEWLEESKNKCLFRKKKTIG